MQVLSREQWDALDDRDKLLLKHLGVEPEEPKEKRVRITNSITIERRLSTKTTCPAPYYAKVHHRCLCCGSVQLLEGRMEQRFPTDNHLTINVKAEIPEGEKFRQLKVEAPGCHDCDKVLSAMPVEVLVKMIKRLTIQGVSIGVVL